MNPSNSSAASINLHDNSYLPRARNIDQTSIRHQIADQLVAPSNVLNYQRPVKRQRAEIFYKSSGMDKRHPSSFQQLEKV